MRPTKVFRGVQSPLSNCKAGDIDWVIVGGESGPGHRPMLTEWVNEVQEQCAEQGAAFFFKQWGGIRPKANGRILRGREWNEFPGERDAVAV